MKNLFSQYYKKQINETENNFEIKEPNGVILCNTSFARNFSNNRIWKFPQVKSKDSANFKI